MTLEESMTFELLVQSSECARDVDDLDQAGFLEHISLLQNMLTENASRRATKLSNRANNGTNAGAHTRA